MEFNIGLRQEIQKAVEEMGFVAWSEIQEQTIPLLLAGKDVIGHSHTGTGKTAAYGIPILERIDFDLEAVQALIICPTRELAVQIREEIMRIAKYMEKCRIVTVYGGDPIQNQIYAIKKKPQIIVGTPGRTIDLLDRKVLKLERLQIMVLDEADEMLKMGFQEDIEKIFQAIPAERQTMMFSATMPRSVMGLAKSYMREPEFVKVIGEEQTNSDVSQFYYKVKRENKTEALYRLLNVYHPKLSLIFCNTKAKVDELTQELLDRGVNCDKIHGDLPQTTRLDVLKKFHNDIIDVMVATDVAARGLDIREVEAVFNYDVPEKADYYVHRIGRTGRMGDAGYSFTLVSKGEMKEIEEIERIIKAKIKKRTIPTYDKVLDVKNDKLIQQVQDLVAHGDLDKEYAIMNKMIAFNLTEDQIIAGLLKMIIRESTVKANEADINEEFEAKKFVFGGAPVDNAGLVRFHLNVGKQDNLVVSDVLDFICGKVKLQRREVQNIAILTEFTFFSVPAAVKEEVYGKLSGTRLKGKIAKLSPSKPLGREWTAHPPRA
ncbi:MAG: DEAD/DEAH box helicase [Bacillota bacterium]|nr:DEAD/DEAH box helicase [Bacillota bacterium]